MVHKGVRFRLQEATERGVWIWEYKIGMRTEDGRIKAALRELAVRRIHQKIDHDLRELHLQSLGSSEPDRRSRRRGRSRELPSRKLKLQM
jgi:hypothetical protein